MEKKLIGKRFKVLDKGFIKLVDYMGDDSRIVQSARVSYGKGTKSYREDSGLINYLLRNDHTSPFEQVVFTFHVKLPIFVARQWIRHRTARLNEISGRYSIMKNEFYVPKNKDIAPQSTNNKQGRTLKPFDKNLCDDIRSSLEKSYKDSYSVYDELIKKNTAKELARISLPLSLYTEWYWQIDLHNLFRFLKLRMDGHAQKEIRDYANVLFKIIKEICPIATNAFEEHILNSVKLSKTETITLANFIKQNKTMWYDYFTFQVDHEKYSKIRKSISEKLGIVFE
jgi:thymidylate synthase (FAD)